MKKTSINHQPGAHRFSTVGTVGMGLLAAAGISAQAVAADTPAGTPIQNQAIATYTDANNNQYEAQSNLATITVQEIYSATIEEDREKVAAPGQTVYFNHVLTNTGNGTDTFNISVVEDISIADTLDCVGDPRIFQDGPVNGSGNGQVDAGEVELGGGTIELAAGDYVNLVVSCQVPGDAAVAGDTIGVTVTAQGQQDTGAPVVGSVQDLTAGDGRDGLDDTNEDLVTITNNAVLNITKQSVQDTANNTITYTVTVTNTGGTTARDVVIYDGIPVDTTLVGGSIVTNGFGPTISANDLATSAAVLDEGNLGTSGLDLNGNGLTTDGSSEATIGIDFNNDGDTADTDLQGVYGLDSELGPNVTVSFSYTVSYVPGTGPGELPAGYEIDNIAQVTADLDGDGNTDDGVTPSNQTIDPVEQEYAVDADDTADADGNVGSPGVNDGVDDDTDDSNDAQTVDQVASGAEVRFINEITNNSNGPDTIELFLLNDGGASGNPAGAGSPFPAGTVFTIFDATGQTALLDTNFDSTVDTGVLQSGETLDILVKAQLPPGVFGTGDYIATIHAVSKGAEEAGLINRNDPAASSVAIDTKLEVLGEILPPTVDLTNNDADHPGGSYDASDDANDDAVTVLEGVTGETVVFELELNNQSGVSDAFQLFSGGSYAGGGATGLGVLPLGWNVIFRDGPTAASNVITTTQAIPAGGADLVYAHVTISNEVTEALEDNTAAGAVDQNGDGDRDYDIFFVVESANSSAFDVKLDAVDPVPLELVTLIPDNEGQVQPGGSIDYDHTLRNEGNTIETFVLTATNSEPGWGNNVQIDGSGVGDGVDPDTTFSTLQPGDTVVVINADGVAEDRVVGDDGAGNPTITLNPSESLPITVRVFSPSDAPNGTIDIAPIVATYNEGGAFVDAVDTTTVILGQLRLSKTVALDADCDGVPDTDLAVDSLQDVPPSVPGDDNCAVWQVVATNQGTAPVQTVTIYDASPEFTTYFAGQMRSCRGDAGLTAAGDGCFDATVSNLSINNAVFGHTDAAGDESATHENGHSAQEVSGDVTFHVGQGATGAAGGAIPAGESVTVRFTTLVE